MENRSQHKGLFFIIVFFLIICLYGLAMAHGWKAPKEAAQIKNPVKINDKTIFKGKEFYLQLCSHCHGDNAQGGEGLKISSQISPPDLKKR